MGSLADYKAYSKVTEKLKTAILNNKLTHAYIFEGDKASGKESLARDFAKAILCEERPGVGCDACPSCRMIDRGTYRDIYYFGSDDSSVKDKDIEELQARMGNLPMEAGGRNIAIIEDADLMTRRAQNRLLKILEEPYEGSVLILLSENSDRLIPTVRSRCQKFRFYDMGTDGNANDPYRELAISTIKAISKGDFFYEIKGRLGEVSDKKSGLAFLDSMEKEMRNVLIGESDISYPIERAKKAIGSIEEARRNITYNISVRNVLGDLILTL